jgi:ElaB/YqjD/DUF883 family membrane-anchored ribosome-binding protein
MCPEVGLAGFNPLDYIAELLERIRQVIQSVVDTIRDRVNHLIDTVSNSLSSVATRIVNALDSVTSRITSWLSSVVAAIREKLDDVVDSILAVAGYLAQKLSEIVANLAAAVQSAIATLVSRLSQIADVVREALSSVANTIGSWIAAAVQYVSEFIERVRTTIAEAIGNAVSAVGNWLREVLERIERKFQEIQQRIGEALDTTYRRIAETMTGFVNRFVAKVTEIWNTVETFARRTLAKVFAFLAEATGRATVAAQYIVKIAELIWGYITSGDFATAFKAVDEMFRGFGLPPLLSWARSFVAAIAYFYLTVQLQFIPLQMMTQAKAQWNLRLQGLDLQTAAIAVHLGYLGEDAFYECAKRAGIPDELARGAFATIRKFPAPGQLMEAHVRGIIGDGEFENTLRLLGYDDAGIRVLRQLEFVLPSPSDLIRMAVREVFTPEVAEKFGQFEDFPKEFAEWAKKVGLTEEIAKWYWAAHWELPSATQGFEMFHRGIISENELKMLLRALDVMPFWRERLIQLSYNVVNRVDARRLYKLGIWDEERLYRAYLDMGYKPEDAQGLVEFTKRYYAPEDVTELEQYQQQVWKIIIKAYRKGNINRDEAKELLLESDCTEEKAELMLTVADTEIRLLGGDEEVIPLRTRTINIICDAYKRGVLDADEARQYLGVLDVPENEQEWYVRLSDFEVQADDMVTLLEIAHKKYAERTWDLNTTSTFLSELGLTGSKIQELVSRWEIDRMATFRKPTEAQFRAALMAGIISLEEYAEELRGLGFDERYVAMLVELARRKL